MYPVAVVQAEWLYFYEQSVYMYFEDALIKCGQFGSVDTLNKFHFKIKNLRTQFCTYLKNGRT